MVASKTRAGTQFARVSTVDGNAPSGFVGVSNAGLAPLCDDQGRLLVRVTDDDGFVDPVDPVDPSALFFDAQALAGSGVIVAEPAKLLQVRGFALSEGLIPGPVYFQLFDSAQAPNSGAVPFGVNLALSDGESFEVTLVVPKPYASGITFGFSEDADEFDSSPSRKGWVNAVYR